MTTELVQNAEVSPTLHTLEEHTYYRSRVFTAESGINALIIAAQPLLVLLTRLVHASNPPEFQHLAEHLIHELKTFESRCLQHRIDNETISEARFLLAFALNETLKQQSWHEKWQSENPLTAYLPAASDRSDLLALLSRLHEEPQRRIDLIELAYVCLSLASLEKDMQALMDPLYQRIRQQRGDTTTQLFLSKISKVAWQHRKSFKIWPLWISITLAVVLLGIFYTGFTSMIYLNTRVITASVNHTKQVANHEDL